MILAQRSFPRSLAIRVVDVSPKVCDTYINSINLHSKTLLFHDRFITNYIVRSLCIIHSDLYASLPRTISVPLLSVSGTLSPPKVGNNSLAIVLFKSDIVEINL